jgi:hypothetical protein
MSAVFGVQDSWLWKMDTSIPVEDVTHQTLWRQLVRWMVEDAPAPFEIMASPSRVAPGEPVSLRARVTTPFFADVNDATVTVTVTSPTGTTQNVPLEWTLREDGTYAARFTPNDTGRYVIDAVATRGRDSVQTATSSLLVDERGADVAQAELRASLLRRIADETGGRYYSLADAGKLAEDAVITEAGVTVREAKDLWDMPAVFLLIALLLGTEWGYRRWRGLASRVRLRGMHGRSRYTAFWPWPSRCPCTPSARMCCWWSASRVSRSSSARSRRRPSRRVTPRRTDGA